MKAEGEANAPEATSRQRRRAQESLVRLPIVLNTKVQLRHQSPRGNPDERPHRGLHTSILQQDVQRHPLLRELPPEVRQRERGRTEIRSCPGGDLRSQIILPLDIKTKRTGRRTEPSQSPRVTGTGQCGIGATSRPSQKARQSVKRTSTTGCGTSTIGSTGEGDGFKGVEKTRRPATESLC